MKIKIFCISLLFLLLGCESNSDSELPITELKDYALNFAPCDQPDCTPFSLPPFPKEVNLVLKNRIIDDELIIYNSLILAKQYHAQLKRAHQSYEINRKHPSWIVFQKYSGEKITGELVLSHIIFDWLENSKYKNHEILLPVVNSIKEEKNKIERGVYWKSED